MRIKTTLLAFILITVIFTGIATTMALDIWTTTSDKIPVTYKDGEHAGEYNPEDIRGSYSFDDVSRLFEVDIAVLLDAFAIDPETEGTEILNKDLETLYEDLEVEIGNGSVQLFVAMYKNLPLEPEDTYLLSRAVEIIMEENKALTQAQKAYLETHQVAVEGTRTLASGSGTEPVPAEPEVKEEEENLVNGSTTFQKILDAGITREQISEILGKPMPLPNQTVKDFCLAEGLSFSSIKEQLNELAE
ncbi:MAG TPA: hypothetical protein VLN47_02850 [Clostridiaceae bacterium]|nr:hypothetical protein [Clostridiaceae bacterium]